MPVACVTIAVASAVWGSGPVNGAGETKQSTFETRWLLVDASVRLAWWDGQPDRRIDQQPPRLEGRLLRLARAVHRARPPHRRGNRDGYASNRHLRVARGNRDPLGHLRLRLTPA